MHSASSTFAITTRKMVAAWRLLAQLDLDRDKLDDAEQRLKRAAEFEPDHPDALELEGMLRNRRDQPGEAAAALERSLESKAHCWRANSSWLAPISV